MVLIISIPAGSATLEWEIFRTLKLDAPPLDMAISSDAKSIYILTQNGEIQIFDLDGRLKDKIELGKPVDQIQLSPDGDHLFVTDRQNKVVEVVKLDFIKQITIQGSPFKGPENAPVVIADFSDFEWRYCAGLVPLFEQVLEKNPDTVKIVFKNFPIRSHKFALNAALAALAAGRQGKFWEFHDQLFKNYNRLNEEKVQQIAEELKLDKARFEKDRRDPLLLEIVKHDVNQGIEAGINSVPTVFVNGRRLTRRSLEGFQELIDKSLKNLDITKP